MRRAQDQFHRLITASVTTILIFVLLLPCGCSEDKDDDNPITPGGSDPIPMVLIPAGTFRMGNVTDHPRGLPGEKPVHDVTISHAFLMSETEITQAQYQAVMGDNPSEHIGDDLPVEYLTWYEAADFCNRLSVQEGLDTCYSGIGLGATAVCDFSASGYRLPTEAEWEYACRGGTETDLQTGDLTNPDCTPVDPEMDRAGWYCGNATDSARAVGQKQANGYGLYDMHGNVWEMCWDWYDSNYYSASPASDPRGPAETGNRVIRSGTYFHYAVFCRSSFRHSFIPHKRTKGLGFRIVRTQ